MTRELQHGITAREAAILGRSDAGVDAETIATELNLKATYVASVIARYVVTPTERWQDSARKSSDRLLAALALHHPRQAGRQG